MLRVYRGVEAIELAAAGSMFCKFAYRSCCIAALLCRHSIDSLDSLDSLDNAPGIP